MHLFVGVGCWAVFLSVQARMARQQKVTVAKTETHLIGTLNCQKAKKNLPVATFC